MSNTWRTDRRTPQRRQQTSNTSQESVRRHRPDYSLLVYATILLALGAITVYAISPGVTAAQGLDADFFSRKQLLAIALGVVTFIIASFMRPKTWKQLEVPLLIAAVIVSLAVRLFGEPVYGAYRWLDIGGISFQAAELIKFALVIWLASFLARAKATGNMTHPDTLKRLGVAVAAVVVVVAGLQSDLGSAAVMMAIIGAMAFIAGLPFKKVALVGVVIILLSTFAIVLSPYRRDRVATFLNPSADCQNEGYQACQALITVGSGGVVGKGLGKSVQAYGYLPEAANDSIFAIVAEKFGFIGAATMLALFAGLFKRIKITAEQAPSEYTKLLVFGILIWLSVQMIINVGAMVGLLPIKGITLPFVSYGGTSIIFVMAALGIVFQVSRYTDMSRRSVSKKPQLNGAARQPRSTRLNNRQRVWN